MKILQSRRRDIVTDTKLYFLMIGILIISTTIMADEQENSMENFHRISKSSRSNDIDPNSEEYLRKNDDEYPTKYLRLLPLYDEKKKSLPDRLSGVKRDLYRSYGKKHDESDGRKKFNSINNNQRQTVSFGDEGRAQKLEEWRIEEERLQREKIEWNTLSRALLDVAGGLSDLLVEQRERNMKLNAEKQERARKEQERVAKVNAKYEKEMKLLQGIGAVEVIRILQREWIAINERDKEEFEARERRIAEPANGINIPILNFSPPWSRRTIDSPINETNEKLNRRTKIASPRRHCPQGQRRDRRGRCREVQ